MNLAMQRLLDERGLISCRECLVCAKIVYLWCLVEVGGLEEGFAVSMY